MITLSNIKCRYEEAGASSVQEITENCNITKNCNIIYKEERLQKTVILNGLMVQFERRWFE